MTFGLNPLFLLLLVNLLAITVIPYLKRRGRFKNVQKQYAEHKFFDTEWAPFYRFQLLYLKKSNTPSMSSKIRYNERWCEILMDLLQLDDYHKGEKEITTAQLELLNQLSACVVVNKKGKSKVRNYRLAKSIYTQLQETLKDKHV